jgi:hypothetical protein
VTDGDGSTRWRPDRNAAQMHLELLGDAAVGVRAESSAPVESERGAPADNHCRGDYTRLRARALYPEVCSTARAFPPLYVGRL